MKIPSEVRILGLSSNRESAERTLAEAKRVGLDGSVFWNIRSVWDSFCIKNIPQEKRKRYMWNVGPFSCSRGHYHMIVNSLDFGEESLWVLEDDCRFLKDVDEMRSLLAEAPSDADILLLDYGFGGGIGGENEIACKEKMKIFDGNWWKVHNADLRGTGNYIISRRAMEIYARLLTRGAELKHIYAADQFRTHHWFGDGINIWAAKKHLSIQQNDPRNSHMCGNDTLDAYKRQCGIDVSLYAEW